MDQNQFDRLQTARMQLQQATRAFVQNPTPALSNSIRRLQRHIRHLSLQWWAIECTDTFGGEANYCWVRRFRVKACSIRGAAIAAGRRLGYSGRLQSVGSWDDGARYDVAGAPVCFFVWWFDEERDDEEYPIA